MRQADHRQHPKIMRRAMTLHNAKDGMPAMRPSQEMRRMADMLLSKK
jgi:hypothetical protein